MSTLRGLLGPLCVFDAVYKAGSVSRAAARLHVTSGAVSQQLKHLEEALNVPLFSKAGRTIKLTEAGHKLAHCTADSFDRLQAALNQFEHRGTAGRLRLKVIPSFAIKWLVPRLASFCAAYRDIDVEVDTVARLEDVESLGNADFVVRQGDGNWRGLQCDLLFEDAFVPICSPSLAPLIRTPRDLLDMPLVHSMMRPQGWSIWLASLGLQAETARRNITLANTALCVQAAADGVGVAMAQQAYATEDLQNGRVVVPIDHVARTGEGYFLICEMRRAQSYPLLEFREWARTLSVEPRALHARP